MTFPSGNTQEVINALKNYFNTKGFSTLIDIIPKSHMPGHDVFRCYLEHNKTMYIFWLIRDNCNFSISYNNVVQKIDNMDDLYNKLIELRDNS
jgi:hypothetical protein